MISYVKLLVLFAMLACNSSTNSTSHSPNILSKSKEKNYLAMKIDGQEWVADGEVFGSYHFSDALGPGLINIAGTKGIPPNDQPFNINLYNTNSTGEYKVNIADGAQATLHTNVAQLAQLSATNYLCGGLQQGSQMVVKITKVSKDPQVVEATFSGSMQCVEGNKLSITEGKFYYHENNK